MAILNERIKEQRTKAGLTLLQVADALGVKEATVQRYESGEIKNIKHDVIEKMSECFNCSPAYLMGWQYTEKKQNSEIDNKFKPIIDSLDRSGSDLEYEDIENIANQLDFLIEYTKRNKK